MKRLGFALVSVLSLSLVVSGLVGCSKSASSSEILIGYSGPLSGDCAAYGEQELWGLQVAQNEINAAGGVLGKQIKLVSYDDRADKVELVNICKRLVTEDKVVAVVTHGFSSCSIAAAPVAEQYKIPFVTGMAGHPSVTQPEPGKVRPYYFRMTLTTVDQGGAIARFAKQKGFTNAAVVYDVSQDYSVSLKDGFKDVFTQAGGTVVAEESIKSGEEDFRAVVTSISAKNPDVIVLMLYYKEAALLIKQARDLALEQPFVGCDTLQSDVLLQLGGSAVEGTYIATYFTPDDPSDKVQQFRTKFKEISKGVEPDTNGAKTYDALFAITEAIKKANKVDSVAIRDALESVSIQGVTGTITIDPATHNPDPEKLGILFIQVKDGKFQFAERIGQ